MMRDASGFTIQDPVMHEDGSGKRITFTKSLPYQPAEVDARMNPVSGSVSDN
jgi:hypothetical protein